MRHIEDAKKMMTEEHKANKFIKVDSKKGTVTFKIQSPPAEDKKDNKVDGCQAQDMLKYIGFLFGSLNNAFPCAENEKTLQHIKFADDWQNIRTENREKRGVEGENKA